MWLRVCLRVDGNFGRTRRYLTIIDCRAGCNVCESMSVTVFKRLVLRAHAMGFDEGLVGFGDDEH